MLRGERTQYGLITLLALTVLCSTVSVSAADPRFVVILDPGHGGDDTGATAIYQGRRVAEKDLTLAVALKTARILRGRGIKAVLTRASDKFVALDRRTAIANATRAQSSIFVSIHANSSDDARGAGAETFIFNAASNEASRRLADLENGKRFDTAHATLDLIMADLATTANYGESMTLACSIQGSAVAVNHARNRGIHQALFYVLMDTRMPSVLFEPGFMSNPAELAKLTSHAYQYSMATALASGILKWKATNASPLALSAIRKQRTPCLIR